ncbi:putative sensor-like histidine kinase [compost metagenome]
MKRSWQSKLLPDTLKGRLSILLVIVTITPIILIGLTSYYWMYKVQLEKVSLNYESMINNEKQTIEKVFDNLSSVSQLLVVDGGLGDDVINYLATSDPLEKTNKFLSIDKSLTNIIYSNPNVSALFFYIPEYPSAIQFDTAPLRPEITLHRFDEIPYELLYRGNQLAFHAPHQSVLQGHDELVVSLARTIKYGVGKYYTIYLEAQFLNLFHSEENGEGKPLFYKLLTGPDGTIKYSDIPQVIPVGTVPEDAGEQLKHYKLFASQHTSGWQLQAIVPLAEYQKELRQWQRQFLLMGGLSLLLTIAAASYIWRMVYRPLRNINREIKRFSNNQTEEGVLQTHLKEFDMLFSNFHEMRKKIIDLIYEVEQKEKRRGELEVEKLMSQINPHFLHNSLNTIQWLARANGQQEIYNLVKVFTRILHYNLGKTSMIVTIQEEIGALIDYIELQNIRYDHRFNIKVELEPGLEDVPIPRFVLQPLVENSLYHGMMSEKGDIAVKITRMEPGLVSIIVSDNGKGIQPEKLQELLKMDENRKAGLGIGLNYVKKMLDVHYDHQAEMMIESIIDQGTTIKIVIPERDRLKGEVANG